MILRPILLFFQLLASFLVSCEDTKLLLVTIATDPQHHGFRRFEKSLKVLNYDYEVFGIGEEWRGGDIKKTAGGGQKINLMKKGLQKYREDENLVVIFTDSYDVIAVESPEVVLNKFLKTGARVLFSAEPFCWPLENLTDKYPQVGKNEERFLNSGAYMGYVTDLLDIMHLGEIDDDNDDQLYYTWTFLHVPTRNAHKIQLDTRSEIFFSMNGVVGELSVEEISGEDGEIKWIVTKTTTGSHPSFLHANGPIPTKLILNRIGNYIGKTFDPEYCTLCVDEPIELGSDESTWPDVTIGVFIDQPTPFLREYFEKMSRLEYPKSKITMLIYNNVPMHNELVKAFFLKPENEYLLVKYIGPEDDFSEQDARNEAMKECMKNECSYYLFSSAAAHLDNPKTLQILIEQNREVLSPMMVKPNSVWSNMWGAINEDNYYARSPDYMDIVNRENIGIFNVPYVSEIILHKGSILPKIDLVYKTNLFDINVLYATILRQNDIFMHTTNTHQFGHIIDFSNFNPKLVRPEMFEIFDNFKAWVDRYLHPDYIKFFANSSLIQEPCNDVFWFPLVSDEFCDDLIVMMEDFGNWSGGRDNYNDDRLEGGKENVPTVDIHMKQVGWQKHWLHFLKMFVMPMQQKIFPGYWSSPPKAPLSFVVRYRVGEQEFLKPHNDASTYTINIALNRPNIDFFGGGCRFVRRNCSVQSTRKGWVTLHPGRLTHLHEGLRITNGTRYIMVSFVDP